MSDLSYPIVPQSKWDFEGVIFNRNSEGVRAIRSDFETSYFVALDGDTSFAFNGTFSPDGKWFAYPLGTSSYTGVWGYATTADAIQIVSTDPAQSIKYKWNMRSWTSGGTDYGSGKRYIKPIYWVDNQFIIFDGYVDGSKSMRLMNIHTGDMESPGNAEELYEMAGRRALTTDWYRTFTGMLWLPDGSGYIRHNPLAVYSNDNQLIELIGPDGHPQIVSPDSNLIEFAVDRKLALADRKNQVIYDLCFSTTQIYHPNTFIFSPDNRYLAFLVDRYPVIVDLQTMTNTILDYQTDYLLAWFPAE